MEWTAIRVSQDTKRKLEELREKWTRNAERHCRALGTRETMSGAESKNDVIGLDQVIRRLLAKEQDHLARAKKSRNRKVKYQG